MSPKPNPKSRPERPPVPKTKGHIRIGTDFNPSGIHEVNYYKEATAQAVDGLEPLVKKGGEMGRCAAIAQTKFEEAAMWAVKAFTKTEETQDEG